MSEDDKQQSVDDQPDAQAAPAAEEDAARTDDLDTLLSQYDETEESKPEPAAKGDDPSTLTSQMKAMLSEHAQRQYRQDMDSTIKSVRGELDPEFFDDEFVESWIDAQARRDPRLSQAWMDRNNNPAKFDRVRQQLGRAFEKKFKKLPDKGATEDREAVAQSVRGTSNKAPEGKAPEFGSLSDREFAETVRKEYGFSPL